MLVTCLYILKKQIFIFVLFDGHFYSGIHTGKTECCHQQQHKSVTDIFLKFSQKKGNGEKGNCIFHKEWCLNS